MSHTAWLHFYNFYKKYAARSYFLKEFNFLHFAISLKALSLCHPGTYTLSTFLDSGLPLRFFFFCFLSDSFLVWLTQKGLVNFLIIAVARALPWSSEESCSHCNRVFLHTAGSTAPRNCCTGRLLLRSAVTEALAALSRFLTNPTKDRRGMTLAPSRCQGSPGRKCCPARTGPGVFETDKTKKTLHYNNSEKMLKKTWHFFQALAIRTASRWLPRSISRAWVYGCKMSMRPTGLDTVEKAVDTSFFRSPRVPIVWLVFPLLDECRSPVTRIFWSEDNAARASV